MTAPAFLTAAPMPENPSLTDPVTIVGSLEKDVPATFPRDEKTLPTFVETLVRPEVAFAVMTDIALVTTPPILEKTPLDEEMPLVADFHEEEKPDTADRAGPVSTPAIWEIAERDLDVALATSSSARFWAPFAAVRRSVAAL